MSLFSASQLKPSYPAIVRAMVVSIAYLMAAELGHALSFEAIPFATFWPANGILLAGLILSPRMWWPLIVLWAMGANYFSDVVMHGKSGELSLFFILANASETLVGAQVVRVVTRGRLRLNSLQSMPVIFGTGILCPMIGATIASTALMLLTDSPSYLYTWRVWWVADVIGILIATPLVLIWTAPRERHIAFPTLGQMCEAGVLGFSLVWLAEYVFNGRYYLFLSDYQLRSRFPIVLLPILAWIALRFELRGAALANAAIALVAVYFTSHGVGPFAESTEQVVSRAIILQGFLMITTFITLVLGAGLTERRRGEQRQRRLAAKLSTERAALRERKELLQAILNSIDDGVVVVDKQFNLVQVNPAAERMHGHALREFQPEHSDEPFGIFEMDGQTPLAFEQLPLVRILRGGLPEPSYQAVIKHAGRPEGIVVNAVARPVNNRQGLMVAAVVIMHDITQRTRNDEEKQRLIGELQQALREIKTLRGLIPICASCKSIRNDGGYWQKLEAFLMQHADVEFSHGICNDCGEKLYGELWKQSQSDNKVA